jgi:hypothetical protein
VDEYIASDWSATKSCNDCHMATVDRPLAKGGPVRKDVRTHVFEGGHHLSMLKQAATLFAEVSGRTLTVRVTNSGTGHKMPSDERHRSFNLYVTVRDGTGNLLVEDNELAEYRLYYRDMNFESTQIEPHGVREHTYTLPAERNGTVEVKLVYCLNPNQKLDKSWQVVDTLVREF